MSRPPAGFATSHQEANIHTSLVKRGSTNPVCAGLGTGGAYKPEGQSHTLWPGICSGSEIQPCTRLGTECSGDSEQEAFSVCLLQLSCPEETRQTLNLPTRSWIDHDSPKAALLQLRQALEARQHTIIHIYMCQRWRKTGNSHKWYSIWRCLFGASPSNPRLFGFCEGEAFRNAPVGEQLLGSYSRAGLWSECTPHDYVSSILLDHYHAQECPQVVAQERVCALMPVPGIRGGLGRVRAVRCL
jgi:hypothetical protein